MRPIAAGVACLLGGCLASSDPQAPLRPGRVDNTVTLDTDTDGTTHDGFQPHAFGVIEARFALDTGKLQVTGVDVSDGKGGAESLPIQLVVGIFDASYTQTGQPTENNHCLVTLEHDGPLPYADWTGPAGAWFGFEMNAFGGTSTCGALDFPPAWGDNPSEHVTRWTWGAGINPLNPEIAEALAEAWGPAWPDAEPFVVGAGTHWELLPELEDPSGQDAWADGYVDRGYALAWEIGPDGVLVEQGGLRSPVPAASIAASGFGADAWYEAEQVGLLTPAERLTEAAR